MKGSGRYAFIVTTLWLAGSQPADAQPAGSWQDFIGTYTLASTLSGANCADHELDSDQLTIESITSENLRLRSGNDPAYTVTFDSDRGTFSGFGMSGSLTRTRREASVDIRISAMGCTVALHGANPADEVELPRQVATEEAASPPPTQVAQSPRLPRSERAKAPAEDDGLDDTLRILLFLFLFAAAGTALAQRRRKRRKEKPAPLAGQMLAAVGSDRSGGYEDGLSYGPGASVAAPAAAKAYEALVVSGSHQKSDDPLIEQNSSEAEAQAERDRQGENSSEDEGH